MSDDDIVELDTNYSEMRWREFLWEQRAWIAQFELAMLGGIAMIATVDYVVTYLVEPVGVNPVELGMLYMIVFLGQMMFLLKLSSLKNDRLVKGGLLPRI